MPATRTPRTPPATEPTPAAASVETPRRRPGRPMATPGQAKALTPAERKARQRAKGRAVSVVLIDPAALAVLDAEIASGRTAAEALSWALVLADRHRAG